MNAVNSAEFVNTVHVETLQELIYATVTRVMNAVTMENDVKVKTRSVKYLDLKFKNLHKTYLLIKL